MTQTIHLRFALVIAALGGLMGFALATLFSPITGAPLDLSTAAVEASEAGPAPLIEHGSYQALTDQIEHLQAQLSVRSRSNRTEASIPTSIPVPTPVPPSKSELDQTARNLLAFVLEEHSSETFAHAIKSYATLYSPAAAARKLFDDYILFQQPSNAERVLKRYEELGSSVSITAWQLWSLGKQYQEQDKATRAAAIYARAIKLDPNGNQKVAQKLAELDPMAGLSALLSSNEYISGELQGTPRGRNNLALLMIKTGDIEGGIQTLRDTNGVIDDSEGWKIFLEHAPERAVTELRAAAKTDPYGALGIQLANFLNDGEQAEEALTVLKGVLQRSPNNFDAAKLLGQIDPERGLELSVENLQSSPESADLWELYTSQLRRLGRDEEAVAAGLEAFRLGENMTPTDFLIEAAPNQVLDHFKARLEGSRDDELWGDYADTLWRTGHLKEALTSWQQARRIDNNDSEWVAKIKAVKEGTNPLSDE